MEFLNSFFKSVNERLTSPLYWALLIATIIWNYDIFLTVFFVDNEAILRITWDKLMKATYIHDVLFPTVFGVNLLDSLYPLFAYAISIAWRLVPVAGLAYILLTQVPKIANESHKIERDFMFEREKWNIEYDKKIAEEKAKKLNAEKKQIDAEVNKTKAEVKKKRAVKILTNTINDWIISSEKTEKEIWDKEFLELNTWNKWSFIWHVLTDLIFKSKGSISTYTFWPHLANYEEYIKTLAIHDIIEDKGDDNNYRITKKGNYFLKLSEQ